MPSEKKANLIVMENNCASCVGPLPQWSTASRDFGDFCRQYRTTSWHLCAPLFRHETARGGQRSRSMGRNALETMTLLERNLIKNPDLGSCTPYCALTSAWPLWAAKCRCVHPSSSVTASVSAPQSIKTSCLSLPEILKGSRAMQHAHQSTTR